MCAGGIARIISASEATWSATKEAVSGPQPAAMPARTARARSTVAPHAGQKTGSSLAATAGPPSCVPQAEHRG
eukprot:11295948-Alexandrium_andersonii.AAC.1